MLASYRNAGIRDAFVGRSPPLCASWQAICDYLAPEAGLLGSGFRFLGLNRFASSPYDVP